MSLDISNLFIKNTLSKKTSKNIKKNITDIIASLKANNLEVLDLTCASK